MKNIKDIENKLKKEFEQIEDIAFYNQAKVLSSFQKYKISTSNFSGTSGYGYDDKGRDTLCQLYADVFGAEKALVTPLMTCGTHALSNALFGILKPNDTFVSVTGCFYDSIQSIVYGKNNGSLEDIGVNTIEIPLVNGEFDINKIFNTIEKNKPKLIYIQRSRGYAWRNAIDIEQIAELTKVIKQKYPSQYIMVDNCYCEFVTKYEPTNFGVDIIAGSLIKNPGGGLAPTGGYIAGKKECIDIIERRITTPALGLEVGSYEMGYRLFYQGFFLSPHIVSQALKGGALICETFKELGYDTMPKNGDKINDIVKSVKFNNENKLIKFVQLIQKFSPIDSYVVPMPWEMPGYKDKIIMAAGTFVSGASIELSCDSPIREPYIAYLQGGLTYEHLKIVANEILKEYGKN